jgi:hypothetical protein
MKAWEACQNICVPVVAVATTVAVGAIRVAPTHLPRDPVTFVTAVGARNQVSDDFFNSLVSSLITLDGAVPAGRKLQDLQRGHDVTLCGKLWSE